MNNSISSHKPVVHQWLSSPLDRPAKDAVSRLLKAPDIVRVAIMPDAHFADPVCNGVAIATRRLIYPAAVGNDIGCGISTVAVNADESFVEEERVRQHVLCGFQHAVPILRHRFKRAADENNTLRTEQLSSSALQSIARSSAGIELGTLGRGNHFLELQADQDGRLWLAVHSGSRGIGQAIAQRALAIAGPSTHLLGSIDLSTDAGQAYLHDAAWAEAYAAASRLRMLQAAAVCMKDSIGLDADWSTLFGTSHNHVRSEVIDGETLLVHRKGSAPAGEGVWNIIPGSMGGESFHITGRGCIDALRSSSHGAGRQLSRGQARAKISVRDLKSELGDVTVDPSLIPRLVDEAPSAYRDIRKVMRAQRDLVRIERTLRTLVCHKGA